jgi:outer membrane receptor protein involved in Fe transport
LKEEREMRRFNRVMTAALCTAMLVPAAYAQEAPQPAEDSGDEPIIVTATLRAMDVQDIPLAVTAVAPETLERQGVADIKTLSSISPSFNIQSSQTETQGTSIKIRGVGTTGNNTGLESSVGVFIDGVYQSRPGVALGDLVDLERLEILRGPQGTLFGRNTSAGALNITTRRPNLSEFEGFVNASYGNYDFMNVQAGISAPIAQDLAAVRLSGTWRKRDGYLTSATGAESNDRDRFMLRGQVYIEPSPDISIRLLADYSEVDEKCCDAVIMRETELAPFFAANGLASDGVVEFGRPALLNLATNGQQYLNSSEQWGLSGELQWDFGGAKLTSITAYRDFKSESSQDDFVGLQLYSVGTNGVTAAPGTPPNGDNIKTFTQELRLQGTAFDDKLDWLIGGFYGKENIEAQGVMTLGPDFQRATSAGNLGPATLAPPAGIGANPIFTLTAFGNGGIPVNANGANAVNLFDQEATTFSVFTHNVVNFTDRLSLTLGARYVDEKKVASFDQLSSSNGACQASVTGALNGGLATALAALPAANRTAIINGLVGLNCFPFVAPVTLTAPAALGGGLASRLLPLPREWAQTFKDDEITYTAQLGYKPNEDLLFYAGYSHGFKSGGFNLDATSANLLNSGAILAGLAQPTPVIVAPQYADPSFESEKVDQIEVGVKATIGNIKANLAIFDMKMSDFQVLEFTGIQFLTFNVNSARSTGVELELFGKLSDYISGNFSATYADSRYPGDCAEGVAPAALASAQRLCGGSLTNAPKFTGVMGLTYDGPLDSSGWGLLVNGNINYSSKRRTSTVPLDTNNLPIPFDFQNAYFKMNARIGLTTPDERFTFELWGTNLSNEITRGITANTPLRGVAGARSRIGFVEEPRMYGLTVRAKF